MFEVENNAQINCISFNRPTDNEIKHNLLFLAFQLEIKVGLNLGA